ncbi:MAG TPA: AMP-binding protein [Pseudonocardia sp.]|uniref:acyl-CoA synthetase n=1 Tax=Pseudonocardia sp. TaxID=60912 RepID=UPI002ED7F432
MISPFLRPCSSYDELWRQIDYAAMDIPKQFNLGVACADRHDPDDRALTVVARDRSSTDYTFGELTEQANRLANALGELGIGRGDIVAVVNPQSFETGVSYIGLFRMGALALPLSSLFGPDALRFRLLDAGAKAVIVSAANAPKVREALADTDSAGVPLLIIGGKPEAAAERSFADALAGASAEFTPVRTDAEDPAFLIYTSGTTGNPKGALHAHRIVFGHIPAFETVYEFYPQPGDVLWSPADWAWIAGIMDILVPAWFYGLPVVVDLDGAFEPERAIWLMREFRVSLTLLPATALRMIRASGLPGGGFTYRAICSGGEPLGADLLAWSEDFFGATVNEGYGQTELNACIGNCASVYPIKPGSLGRPLPGTVAAVLDDDGNPVIDQTGELAVDRRHPNTMLEYWRNPVATEEKFRGDWLLTGDLAIQDEDGYVWFQSRKDDVINSAGYRIGPGEIESSLGAHPSVAMAAVIGVPDERRGQVPKAFVVLRPGVGGDQSLVDELRAHVRSRLAPHEVPREIVFLDDLPKTTTGKIMRRALRET